MHTIKKSSEYKKVYKKNNFFTKSFCVHYTQNTPPSLPAQFGFTVSKKSVSKRAVDRNLVKRRLKHAILTHFNHDAYYGYQFVITATRYSLASSWDDYVLSIAQMRKALESAKEAKCGHIFVK